jgi:hypothetical protein
MKTIWTRLRYAVNPETKARKKAFEDWCDALELFRTEKLDEAMMDAYFRRWMEAVNGNPVPTLEEAQLALEPHQEAWEDRLKRHEETCWEIGLRVDHLPDQVDNGPDDLLAQVLEGDMNDSSQPDMLRPLYQVDADGERVSTIPTTSSLWSVVTRLRARRFELTQEQASLDQLVSGGYDGYQARLSTLDTPDLRRSYTSYLRSQEQRVQGLQRDIDRLSGRLLVAGIDPNSIDGNGDAG